MITTERLDLVPFTTASAAAAASPGSDPADPRWADGFPRPDDQDAARMYLQAPHTVFGSWFVEVRDSGLIVGTIGFFGPPDADGTLMVGYGLIPSARGSGYATEALRALAGHGLAQPGAWRILAECDEDNVASHRVLEKAGFHRTAGSGPTRWYALEVYASPS